MKQTNLHHVIAFAVGWILLSTLLSCTKENSSTVSFNKVEKGFHSIPDSMRLGVYWYWISDNISKEAVVKDLESMKAAGINRAYIGNIGQSDVPYGNIKILTPEWWEVLHAALKRATELDIEIGIFNSPGWSQSGGPWVKPQQAMRYLGFSSLDAKGPTLLKTTLPEVGKDAGDVKVIAYPLPPSSIFIKKQEKVKEEGKKLTMDFPLDKTVPVRSLSITVRRPVRTSAEVYVKKGPDYQSVKKIEIDRSNPALNVGFDPYAPIVISLPEITGSAIRLEISEGGQGPFEVELSSQPKVERYPEKSMAKMFQTPLPMWGDYLWETQPEARDKSLLIDPRSVLDITDKMASDGSIEWEVPEGNWRILRTAMLPTGVTNAPASPEATGPEVDKMSKEHVASHFDAFIGEILRRIPEADRKSFKIVVEDSYETGGQNWTDDMAKRFAAQYGYDPMPYLPVLRGEVVGSEDLSDRFLWDLRRLIADRVAYDYVGGLRDVSHQHGLTTWLENYGHWGFPGEFLQYGGQSDEIAGEFWSEGSLGDIENRAASSCAHIYGKTKVWAESFTCGGGAFSRYPHTMKQRGDRFFTEGINNTLLHVYIQQPYDKYPGVNAGFGNEFNRHNTWFSHMDLFSNYLKRCNFMLQQGRYVADVAYFIGEDAPKMTGIRDPEIPKGYSYDYINAEVLLTKAFARDGKLVLDHGMEYSVLVLPHLKTMRPALLKKIEELVNGGICLLGPAPEQSPSLENYPQADKEVQSLAAKMWEGSGSEEGKAYGKGRIFTSVPLEKIFAVLDIVPDFSYPEKEISALYIHRTLPEGEIYFVSNQSDKTISFTPQFRVTGKEPEFWNPVTSETRLLPEYTQKENGTQVPLELQGNESAFIIFRHNGKPTGTQKNFPAKEVIAQISSPWQVSFEKGKGGPEEIITFSQLQDWSRHADSRIKYFSGNALYTTSFTIEKQDITNSRKSGKELYLDLGQVMVMAKIKVNGQDAGGAWTYPYRVNVTSLVKPGENKLEIEVVNNWMNRLIGDQSLPEAERLTWTCINPWRADSPLQASGLLGPVEIQAFPYQLNH